MLAGIQAKMLHPDLVTLFVREYHQDYARRSSDLHRERSRLERRQADAAAKMKRLVEAIAMGGGEFIELRDVLAQARDDRDELAQELAELDALPVVALHSKIAQDYRDQLARLNEALGTNPDARLEVMPIIRSLIDRITLGSAE